MKKVISVVLAFAMIFSVCALGVSAAVNSAFMAIRVKPAAESYAKGDTVTFDVYYEANSEWLGALGTCNIVIGYDSSVFELVDDLSSQPALTGLATFVCEDGYAVNGIVSLANSWAENYTKELTAADKAKGWDSAFAIKMTQDGAYFDASSETKAFGFKLKIKDDAAADGSYVVGVAEAGIADETVKVREEIADVYGSDPDAYWGEPTSLASCFDIADATVKVGPSVVVSHVKQQSKWNGGKIDAANYLFGFVGQVSGLELTTKDVDGRAMVQEIKSITATATVGESAPVTADVVTVWAVDGGYQFRAQFSGFAPTNDATATVTFAITMNDGTTVYTSDAYGRAINDIYAGSLANNFPALAA